MLVHLDGSGAVTFLITIPAMLPLYDSLGMDRRVLATVVALSAGTMNILPWGGPTLRAATALEMPVTELFNPVLPSLLTGLAFVLFIAYRLGKREKQRLGDIKIDINLDGQEKVDEEKQKLSRPGMFYINVLITVISIVVLITGKLPPTVIFMIAFAVTLVINYPNVKQQRERIDAHAKEALMMASILFAAGAFVGIMKE